jgi:uncharacterized protein (DUF433 family)
MPSSQQTKKLSIRIPELELRRIKSLAALRGVTLEQAVRRALEAWASQPEKEAASPHAASPGSLRGDPAEKPERQARAAKRAPARRRDANARPAAKPGHGQSKELHGAALAWLTQAGTLDWSKCSAVESVPTKIGNVWTVRGTRVPVAAIFRRIAEGQEFGEIASASGLTQEQLKAVLQFGAEGGMFSL